jgi:hypothetical protein
MNKFDPSITPQPTCWEGYIPVVREMVAKQRKQLSRAQWFREYVTLNFPYCLHRVDGNNSDRLIWLNREYKPLGMPRKGWVDYSEYHDFQVSLYDARIIKLLPALSLVDGNYYFYNDGNHPRYDRAAMSRYAKLLGLIEMDRKPFGNPDDLPKPSIRIITELFAQKSRVSMNEILQALGLTTSRSNQIKISNHLRDIGFLRYHTRTANLWGRAE